MTRPVARAWGSAETDVVGHSPFRLSGPDVDWGARRPKLLGEDVHPHLHLSLEWKWIGRLGVANLCVQHAGLGAQSQVLRSFEAGSPPLEGGVRRYQ